METALSYLTILPISKEERQVFVQRAKDEILSGEYNPLQIEAVLKGLEETIKAIRGDVEIKEVVYQEAEKYGKGDFSFHGAKFRLTERKNWNFDLCGDSTYNELKAEIEKAKETLKERETFLKAIPEEGMANPDTGEVIHRASFYTTQVLTITL
jgi:predicted CopG family antitoxin